MTTTTNPRWTVTFTEMLPGDTNGQPGLFRVCAIRNDRQAVVRAEKLTAEMVEGFDPDHAWRSGLHAYNRHACAIRERSGR